MSNIANDHVITISLNIYINKIIKTKIFHQPLNRVVDLFKLVLKTQSTSGGKENGSLPDFI